MVLVHAGIYWDALLGLRVRLQLRPIKVDILSWSTWSGVGQVEMETNPSADRAGSESQYLG